MGKLLKAQTTEKAPYLSVICCNYDHHTTTDNIICINCRAIFYILQQGNTGSSHLDISIRDISLLATITSFICKPPSLRSKKRVCFCGGDIQLEMFNAWGHVRSAEKLISMAVTCDRLLVWDVLPRNVSSAKVSTVKDWTWGEKKNGENPGPPGTGAMQVSCHGPMWSIVNQYLWRHSNGKWWKG